MSNVITDARIALVEALNELDYRALTEVPQTYTPPLCWVEPRAPYRKPGQTFSRKKVYLAVVCLAASGTNQAALAAVEEMACGLADAIENMDGYRLDPDEELGIPALYAAAQGQPYLGIPVNVIAEVLRG